MRMRQEHYQALKARIDALPDVDAPAALQSMRVRWDYYWRAGGFSNAQEYAYLKDDHIDTALKAIFRDRATANCPMLTEPYEPQDGAPEEIDIAAFQERLNHIG